MESIKSNKRKKQNRKRKARTNTARRNIKTGEKQRNKYWSKLSKYLEGYERAFSLCKSQCGKLLSSREKFEENLKTGETTKFTAGAGM